MSGDSLASGMVQPMPGLVDTHCHLDDDSFASDRDEVVARAAAVGVGRIVVPAIDLGNVEAVLELTARVRGRLRGRRRAPQFGR